jgi:hypothetical protein
LQNFPKLNQGKENQKKSERKNWNWNVSAKRTQK